MSSTVMSDLPEGAALTGTGHRVRLRGHEVVSHTSSFEDGRARCLVFLFNPHDDRHDLMVFRADGDGPSHAESAALGDALRFLEASSVTEAAAARPSTILVEGRTVEIFCDLVGHERYQAFPFLRGPDGSRTLIMQFHLAEAVTASSPLEAMDRCIGRLQAYFGGPERSHS